MSKFFLYFLKISCLALPIENDKNNACIQTTYLQRLFKVMEIIEKRERIKSKELVEEEYVEIEFKSFKTATLRELEKYINSCLGIGIVKKPFSKSKIEYAVVSSPPLLKIQKKVPPLKIKLSRLR